MQLILPLLGKVTGAYDKAAFDVAPHDELLHQESRHNGLSGTGVICQHKPKWLPGEHFFVDSRYLVRKWLYGGRMHGQVRVEQVGKMDAICLGHQPHTVGIGIEAPRQRFLGEFHLGSLVGIDHLPV